MINELLRRRILGLTGDAATLPPERMEAENQQAIDSLSELTLGKGVLSNQDVAIAEQLMNPAQKGQISDQQLQEQIEMARRMMRDKMLPQAGEGTISDREMEIFRSTAPQGPRLIDGSPLPEGMVPSMTRTLEFRDYNQNGIEDRKEGIYLLKDLVPESSLPPRMNYPDPFFATPEGFGMPGSVSEEEMAILEQAETSEDPEELEGLLAFAEKIRAQKQAPLSELAQELAALGGGEDTALAHVRPGKIVTGKQPF